MWFVLLFIGGFSFQRLAFTPGKCRHITAI
jgi:hypothetical protein